MEVPAVETMEVLLPKEGDGGWLYKPLKGQGDGGTTVREARPWQRSVQKAQARRKVSGPAGVAPWLIVNL